MSVMFTLALSCCLRAGEPQTQNWPLYRGDSQLSGVATCNVPDKPQLLWSFKTTGDIRSAPAVVDGKVYVGSGDRSMYALDANTGKKLWSFAAEGDLESSPLVLMGKVYFGSSDGHLYAVKTENGELAWKFKTMEKVLGAPNFYELPGAHPFASYGILFGSYDHKIYALNAADGKEIWNMETSNFINGAPAISKSIETGNPKQPKEKARYTAFGGCDGLLHVVDVKDGTEARAVPVEQPIAGSPAIEGKFAYFGHYGNEFMCADMIEGKIVWRYKDKDFPFFSSPAIGSEQVIFGGRDKRIHCVKKATGEKIWDFETQAKVDFSPVIAGDKVVCGSSDGRLYVLSLKEGKELWSYDLAQPLTASAAVVNGKIYVGCEDGSLYCFGQK
jgi:outer membrane protein assembly factor BamB